MMRIVYFTEFIVTTNCAFSVINAFVFLFSVDIIIHFLSMRGNLKIILSVEESK